MKNTNDVSLGAVCIYMYTQGDLINKKVENRINKIQKDSKNLVLIDDTR